MLGSVAPLVDRPSRAAATHARSVLAVLLAVCAAWSLLYVARTSLETPDGRVFMLWDDGMISMRYARNLADGHGLVWNPGRERVQGFTNLGVTLVMAAAHLLPLDLGHTSLVVQLASVVLLLGIVVVFHRLGESLFGVGSSAPPSLAAACVLYAPLGIWTLQGSDVGAVALLVGLAMVAFARAERDDARLPAAAVFVPLALGLLVRQDVSIAYALFVGAALLRGRDGLRAAAFGTLLGAITWAGLLAFGWLYYGDPLPNTYYLKNTGTPRDQMWASGWSQTKILLTAWSLPFHAIAVGAAVAFLRRSATLRLCAGIVLAYSLYNVHVGGDWLYGYTSRYVAAVMPLQHVLVIAGARAALSRAARGGLPVPLVAQGGAVAGVAVAAALALAPSVPLREWLDPRQPTMLREYNAHNLRMATYLREHTDPDTVVGVYWAGVPIYFSERPGVDIMGKCDRHTAKLVVPTFRVAHSKKDYDYVLRERQPDVILRGDDATLTARADFREAYRMARHGFETSLFVRADALAKLHDPLLEITPVLHIAR
jgi:hypothetical protein